MNYKINISRHLPRTGRSEHWARATIHASDDQTARVMFADFCKRFPASDGFALVLDRVNEEGFTLAYSDGA